jgi:methyl-accepting chemotaxis protein
MATMVTALPGAAQDAQHARERADRDADMITGNDQRAGDAILHDSLFFQRLADRLAFAGLLGLGACAWALRDLLPAIGTGRRLWVLVAASVCFGTFIANVIVRFLVGRLFLRPTARLTEAAERVADGDFVTPIPPASSRGATARLTRSMARMTSSLRQLTRTVRDAAREATDTAQAITAGGAHMAATAQHIADTSNELSRQAGGMADTIDALVADAGRLVAIASELTDGAQSGVARNAQLRQLALESGARLVESAAALETLAADAHSSAAAVEELARASEEIQSFVTLVTKMARQSKLLALNAAMEAARAGEQGQGFAVVASEVRRLAASSSDAAERTEALVKGVLERVAESRAASARAASTVDAVRAATELGLESFRRVEEEARETERWTGTIQRAAMQSSAQVGEMNGRLAALADGTQRFATAMEEVAAASQEQSASTEEIAAAGTELLRSAARLHDLTAAFQAGDAGGGRMSAMLVARDSAA